LKLAPDTHSAEEVIKLLDLAPLEREGGFFRRTAESSSMVFPPNISAQPSPGSPQTHAPRRAWSAILALFTPECFSALHRLAADELWFFHAGDSLECLRLFADGRGSRSKLGLDATAGERAQDVVSAGVWQGARLVAGGRWALVSCVVVPEFAWHDFELGDRAKLAAAHPEFAPDIAALTRSPRHS
jgi:predicted cupin superfamily sugar epimerase